MHIDQNVQVPICPLCQQPVPIKRGEQPDIRVNEHIDQNCLSYLAKKKRSAPKCGIKGCPKREVVTTIRNCGSNCFVFFYIACPNGMCSMRCSFLVIFII